MSLDSSNSPSARVTITDIARRANVSKSTVSRVLNNPDIVQDSKRAAVLEAMGSMGFKPNRFAQSLASGQSMVIGILTQNIGTSFYDTVIRGITEGLRNTGYSPVIGDGRFNLDDENAAIQTLFDRHVDGLILVGGDLGVEAIEAISREIPTVVVARELADWKGPCIGTSNFETGYMATQHLIDNGHRNIVHIAGDPKHDDAVRRRMGYQQALKDAGIDAKEDWIFEGNFYGQSGILGIESFLTRGIHFSAVFAANDLSAYGVALALSRHRIRVPDEVSIVGVDDKLESALMIPPLTTIRQPAMEIGETSAKAVIDLINKKEVETRVFPAELVVRESVSRMH